MAALDGQALVVCCMHRHTPHALAWDTRRWHGRHSFHCQCHICVQAATQAGASKAQPLLSTCCCAARPVSPLGNKVCQVLEALLPGVRSCCLAASATSACAALAAPTCWCSSRRLRRSTLWRGCWLTVPAGHEPEGQHRQTDRQRVQECTLARLVVCDGGWCSTQQAGQSCLLLSYSHLLAAEMLTCWPNAPLIASWNVPTHTTATAQPNTHTAASNQGCCAWGRQPVPVVLLLTCGTGQLGP